MSQRNGSPRVIDAAAVHDRRPDGELVPTAWARLLIPRDWVRLVPRPDGGEDLELHVEALCKLTSHRPTVERLKRAARLCACPFTVIRPEDLPGE